MSVNSNQMQVTQVGDYHLKTSSNGKTFLCGTCIHFFTTNIYQIGNCSLYTPMVLCNRPIFISELIEVRLIPRQKHMAVFLQAGCSTNSIKALKTTDVELQHIENIY